MAESSRLPANSSHIPGPLPSSCLPFLLLLSSFSLHFLLLPLASVAVAAAAFVAAQLSLPRYLRRHHPHRLHQQPPPPPHRLKLDSLLRARTKMTPRSAATHIRPSEIRVSMELDQLSKKLEEVAVVNLMQRRAIISLIGNIQKLSLILEKVFHILRSNGINVQKISQGASKVNISLVVNDSKAEQCVTSLHSAFFETDPSQLEGNGGL
ncbi:hypothetical protein Droror1_Dr00008400 [Drosera rotundifolia]